MWTILAVGLFNSIMFPTIFSLGVAELGPLTATAPAFSIWPSSAALSSRCYRSHRRHVAFTMRSFCLSPVTCTVLYFGLSG